MANYWRLNQIEKAKEKRVTPFNEEMYNDTVRAIRKIANYCEIVGCDKCRIKNDLHCAGKLGQLDSPFHWLDTE